MTSTPFDKVRFLSKTRSLSVLLTCLLPYLVTKGSGVSEKKVMETQVSKTLFGNESWPLKVIPLK